MIPILDLKEQYAALKPEIDKAVTDVFAGGHFINGPNVQALEREIAEYVGTRYAVGLNSGTDALHLALRALDIGPGDEVITSPFTFVATTEAIGLVGATPVFADIDPDTFNISPSAIEAAITLRTKAILPIHLYGRPADMQQIMSIAARHGVAVIEDCAQAIGAESGSARVGSMGTFGCFSFFPSKNLGAFGDGGMLTTNDESLASRAKSLRAHGGRIKYHHEELGVNSRLDEVQAAILRVKLPHLEQWIKNRRANAVRYGTLLADVKDVKTPDDPQHDRHVYHQYTVRVNDRDAVQKKLAAAGVQTMVYYPVPLHVQEVHAQLGYRQGDMPHSERAALDVLSLPMFPELTQAQAEATAQAIRIIEAAVAV